MKKTVSLCLAAALPVLALPGVPANSVNKRPMY